ncbi:MAG: hypothetical protein Tsb0018_01820 [Opitutales bacterium]
MSSITKMMKQIYGLIVCACLLSACTGSKSVVPPQEQTNALGVVKTRPRSYAKLPPTSFNVHSDEVSPKHEYSGDETSYLWRLIRTADY